MKKLFFGLCALCALYSCNDSVTTEETSDAAPAVEEVSDVMTEESATEVVTEEAVEAVAPVTEVDGKEE